MEKLKLPLPLSFYLIQSQVYFNTSKEEGGVPHPDLWRKVVMKAFPGLSYENKVQLFDHCYGAERGRVVYIQESDQWILYGTPGCGPFKFLLLKAFSLKEEKAKVDFKTDLHYRTIKSDVSAVTDSLSLAGPYFRILNTTTSSLTCFLLD